jgi:hypothetical protein
MKRTEIPTASFDERYGPWICMGCGKPHKLGADCPSDLADEQSATEGEAMNTRTTDPAPADVLEVLGEIIESLSENERTVGMEGERAYVFPYSAVRRTLAEEMNIRGWRFSSAYRIEATPLHAHVYAILGGTVSLNAMADDLRAKGVAA